MEFFDGYKNRVEIIPIKVLSDKGRSGVIYLTSEGKVLKVYKDGAEAEIDFNVVKHIQDLNLPHLFEIEQILSDANGNVRAILMPYYEPSQENILYRPSEFIVNNIKGILSSFDILASEGIMANDIHSGNIIIGSSSMTVIDTDLYSQQSLDETARTWSFNRNAIAELFRNMLYEEARRLQSLNPNEGFAYNFYYDKEDAETLCQMLEGYLTPYDFLVGEREKQMARSRAKAASKDYKKKSKRRYY